MKTWFVEKALPWAKAVGTEWWDDIADKPRPHFVSMVFGIVLYLVIRLAVFIAS